MLPDPNRVRLVTDIVDVMGAVREPPASIHRVGLGDRVGLAPLNAPWSLTALSPSHEDERHHAATLAQLVTRQKAVPGRYGVNSGSAVLRLEANGVTAIFGSDLDVGESVQRGWQAIVRFHGQELGSDLVKVGHHGSRTALHEAAWVAFTSQKARPGKPLAVVTPFPAPAAPLPRPREVKQLKQLSSRLHLSGILRSNSKRAGRVPLARTPFSSYTKTSPSVFDQVGHVRYRFNAGRLRSVEAFEPAREL